jgi:hypothetical protein
MPERLPAKNADMGVAIHSQSYRLYGLLYLNMNEKKHQNKR